MGNGALPKFLRGGLAEIAFACFIDRNVPAARSNFAKLVDRSRAT
jgi:hypothetical protein